MGLRARELSSLTESSFDLITANPPTMIVEAGYSKRRRRDMLPVHPLLAETLTKWFTQRQRDRDSAPPIALKSDANNASERPPPQTKKPRKNRGFEHVGESLTTPEISTEGGSRTHTPSEGYWILNPARLPFRHFGSD